MKRFNKIIMCFILLFSIFTFVGCSKNIKNDTNNTIQGTNKISKEDRQTKPPMPENSDYENQ